MAMKNSLLVLLMSVLSSSFFLLLVVARKQYGLETNEAISNHYHNLQITSFEPSSICTRSTKGSKSTMYEHLDMMMIRGEHRNRVPAFGTGTAMEPPVPEPEPM
ncbi:hypothetical protein OSB04_025691 [Centaurea solstitialis]|uniref:Transmembrane protein n=1 Tax=Centaurea solstitialis TaxID=347529 RepID=A0AA38SNJ4_9ASTR|nr:hypothetical protein OSB04_025691 [Centaurea solstitialis]